MTSLLLAALCVTALPTHQKTSAACSLVWKVLAWVSEGSALCSSGGHHRFGLHPTTTSSIMVLCLAGELAMCVHALSAPCLPGAGDRQANALLLQTIYICHGTHSRQGGAANRRRRPSMNE